MSRLLVIFIFLQLMDFATTLIAFSLGGTERNPLVSHFLPVGHVRGLLISKLILISIAGVGAYMGKKRGLRWANVIFMLVVIWNITIIVRLALAP